MTRRLALRSLVVAALLAGPGRAQAFEVGFGHVDITPRIEPDRPVWIAGYGQGRRATGIHDPLHARAVVLRDGPRKVALVAVDLIGFMLPNVEAVRGRLEGFDHVLIASTHNHEGPDTIGLWGPDPRSSGVDRAYLRWVEGVVVEAVHRAESGLAPARADYGSAADPGLLRDGRLPVVKDDTLRVLRFASTDDGRSLGLVVQWSCHPETLGSRNAEISADFPAATIAALEARHRAPVVYFSGAVGGMMTNPRGRLREDGPPVPDGTFDYARRYGEAVADLADTALAGAGPIELTPVVVSSRPVALPLANPLYRLARTIGVLDRAAFAWTGDPGRFGEPIEGRAALGPIALRTEVAYLRLGELHVAAIPGELYPELLEGRIQEPADPAADLPDAPLEPPVLSTLPGPKVLVLGLANDEVGYIIPRRQWDEAAPFAYGRSESQYGEINSVGPETAPILLEALRECVAAASPRRAPDRPAEAPLK